MTIRSFATLLTAILFVLPTGVQAQQISLESLLKEMVDRDQIARFPDPEYINKQFSSYDRASEEAGTQEWFANWDRTNFLREENNSGRREFVLYDADGPGVMVRYWMTFGGPGAGEGILRFYIDGSEKPVIEGNAMEVLSGGIITGAPLSSSVSPLTDYGRRGHNLYLPIPYAENLKITYESENVAENGAKHGSEDVYYNINYRSYPPEVNVHSFSTEQLEGAEPLLDEVQQKLAEKDKEQELEEFELAHLPLSRTLKPGDNFTKEVEGPAAIRKVMLQLLADNVKQALRSTVMEIRFDGNETFWVPVGDFFGTGYQIRESNTWYTTVTSHGMMSAYWVMPFQRNAEITFHNMGEQTVHLQNAVVSYSDWNWDERSMYFGSSWKQYSNLYTGEQKNMEGIGDPFDVSFTHLKGQGVFVGDVLTLFNTAYDWWGEGDEKIYVDGEDFPSHFGTGTEDYYGYAWVRPEIFNNHPFIAQPDGSGNITPGYTINTRFRVLDAIPFNKELKLDMELWHWTSTLIDYAPVTYFYLRPAGDILVKNDTANVKREVNLKREDVFSSWIEHNKIDGQNLIVDFFSGGKMRFQYLYDVGFTGNKHLWWHEAKPGDKLHLRFKSKEDGTFKLMANLTKAPEFSTVRIWVNGKRVSKDFNGYSESFKTEKIELGEFELEKGDNYLEVEIQKNSPDSEQAFFGLDYIDFEKI
ncbi:MAG: DUF2961 domain-containing protein [Gracilimonas sp.]|nr:DUF2961 domain-containing protein [Gracilimonas sp.]